MPVTEILKIKGTELAKDLHEEATIYALYGLLDGMSLSYSMVKYAFDMLCNNSNTLSSDAMHNWMMTREGMAAIAAESFFIISFSYLANIYEPDNKDQWKSFLAVMWPYCRDSMKGLKNAYKGIRSTFLMAEVLGIANLRDMIVPVGLLLGVFSAFNRMWMRKMIVERKEMMRENSRLLKEAQELDFTREDCDSILKRIGKQTNTLKYKGLAGAAYGGVVDGMYLFMGVMSVSALPLMPQVYLALSVCNILFTTACIATRMYEEYDFQRQLIGTQAKIELALYGKEIYKLFLDAKRVARLLKNASEPAVINQITLQYQELGTKLEGIMSEFEGKKAFLRSLQTLSYTSAALDGLRSGLAAYSAIASAMFAYAAINMILTMSITASVSPTIVIGTVASGMAVLIFFMGLALYENYCRNKQQENNGNRIQKLSEFINDVKLNINYAAKIKPTEIKSAIEAGSEVDDLPQYYFQQLFEVIRSFFSGVAKGQKSVDYTLNPLQETNEQGHYHDTPIMLKFTIISSILYTLGLALRALAKGFGRPPITQVETRSRSSSMEEVEIQFSSDEEDDSEIPPARHTPVPSASSELRNCSSEPRIHRFDSPHYMNSEGNVPAFTSGTPKEGSIISNNNTFFAGKPEPRRASGSDFWQKEGAVMISLSPIIEAQNTPKSDSEAENDIPELPLALPPLSVRPQRAAKDYGRMFTSNRRSSDDGDVNRRSTSPAPESVNRFSPSPMNDLGLNRCFSPSPVNDLSLKRCLSPSPAPADDSNLSHLSFDC